MPIYPARELPIEGVSERMIGEKVTAPWCVCEREKLEEYLAEHKTDVVVSFGAGNIDAYCQAIARTLEKKA